MSDQWDFYFSYVNDVIASLFVDVGIRKSVPDPARPWLLWAWVQFLQPRDDGLSSADEAPLLHEIEEQISKEVKTRVNADLVGRITTSGRREFYFYGVDATHFKEAVSSAMMRFPHYKIEVGIQHDPAWSQYLDLLYPTPRDWQRIKNRHVIEQLEKHGDPLTVPRAVNHWAYFESSTGRSQFIAKASITGFRVVGESESRDSETGKPYGVQLERIDRVDWNSINTVTLELFELALHARGEYDGWETSVEKAT